jgi:hypothetical protein
VDEDDEVAVRGVGGSQQRRPAKSPTASRWRLGVEQQEEDEDFGLLFFFLFPSYTESVWLGWTGSGRMMGCCWAGSVRLRISLFFLSPIFNLFSFFCFDFILNYKLFCRF